jgi:hypothetical protein
MHFLDILRLFPTISQVDDKVRNLWPLAVDESFLLSSPRNTHSNWTYTVLNWWVLCDIGEKWCEEWYNIPVIHDLTELNEHLAVEIPPSARVYPSGRHATAIPIVVMSVDNNRFKTMSKRTCIRLDVPLKVKSEIEMVPEVFWVVSWGEVCLTSLKWFRICESRINDSFYLSKVFTSRKVRTHQL